MKSTLFAAAAAIALLAPAAFAPAFAQPEQYQRDRQGEYDGQSPRTGDRDSRRGDDDRDYRDDGRDDDRDYRNDRRNWRESSADARWDEGRHNGYYLGNRWAYGPPTVQQIRRGAVPGYQPWSAGRNLGYYNRRFQEVDYRREHLRQPPRGHRWVRDDRGDFLLISNRNGRIVQIAISGHQPRDRRQSWRDRAETRWDDDRHNGYYRDSRWSYGPPPNGASGVVLGYQPWARGQRLGYYDGRYEEVDYRSRRDLRQPPRGYHWVRNDSGDYLLAAIVGGLIAQVILNDNR